MAHRPMRVLASLPRGTPQGHAAALAAAVLLGAALWAGPEPGALQPRPEPPPMGPPLPPGPPAPPSPPPPSTPMRFGLDAGSLALQLEQGVQPDYATIWIGPWNLEKGWRDPALQLAALRAANVTPAIHLYYWGDDISPACLESGCKGKSVAGWDALAAGLVDHLHGALGGAPVLVVLETEFNKAPVARHEPLDALLAEKARALKEAYPAARVVLGIGGWYPPAWETWDRAAAASDAVGVQAMAGTPPAGRAPDLFDGTLAGARRLRELFGKPIVLQDIAAPSGPAPATPATQAETLVPFVANLAALKAEGVDTLLYRSFPDNPAAPAGYFGEAERHFGLALPGTGDLKPSGEAWVEAMRLERGEAGGRGGGPPGPG